VIPEAFKDELFIFSKLFFHMKQTSYTNTLIFINKNHKIPVELIHEDGKSGFGISYDFMSLLSSQFRFPFGEKVTQNYQFDTSCKNNIWLSFYRGQKMKTFLSEDQTRNIPTNPNIASSYILRRKLK
jgi:hypothetical protein